MTEKVSVLVVDDHMLFRQGLKKILDDHSWIEVIGEADDGNNLLKLLEHTHPNIIILDISLPGLSGIKITSLIREKYPSIKILILTMHKSEGYFHQALKAGASGYVLKDSADTELLLAISALRKGEKYISPLLSDVIIDACMGKPHTVIPQQQTPILLSTREKEVLKLICEGNFNKEIAYLLRISIRTVEHHRNNIMRKCGVHELASLVKYAIGNGLIEFPPINQ